MSRRNIRVRGPNAERGWVTLPILLLLLFLLVVVAGAGSFVYFISRPAAAIRDSAQWQTDRALVLSDVERALNDDPTPDSDGPSDPIFALDRRDMHGFHVGIHDESSRLPLSWIDTSIFENTPLKERLKPGASVAGLQLYREDTGYGYDIAADYKDFFDSDAMKELFTAFGWANVNISGEEALVDLFRFRVGTPGSAEAFRDRIRQKRIDQGLWTDSDMTLLFGANLPDVYPTIGVLPTMNVNFVPEKILRDVVTYPFPQGAIQGSQAIVGAIISIRQGSEIRPDVLFGLIPTQKDQQKRVFSFLGTRTWFWRIDLERDGKKEFVILSLAPIPNDATPNEHPKGRMGVVWVEKTKIKIKY